MQFTPDGQHLVVGSLDGLVEVYDFETGLVDKRLEYQEKVGSRSVGVLFCPYTASLLFRVVFHRRST